MRLLIALALLATVSIANATDWDIPPDALENALPKDCDASADAGLANCAAQAFEAADAELNEVWKKVLAAIEPGGPSIPSAVTAADAAQWKADLVQAQEAWNTFKDKDCNGARSYEYWGGSGRGLAVTSCLYVYTVTRTEDLKARYLSD